MLSGQPLARFLFIAERLDLAEVFDLRFEHLDESEDTIRGDDDRCAAELSFVAQLSEYLSDAANLGGSDDEPGAPGIDQLPIGKAIPPLLLLKMSLKVGIVDRPDSNGVHFPERVINRGNNRHTHPA